MRTHSSFADFSARAAAVTLRTYCRPSLHDSTVESWSEVVHRAHYDHHLQLWDSVSPHTINTNELLQLSVLGLNRQSLVAGRTLWLGGTPYAFEKPCCQFNCSYTRCATVYDVVDIAWLLLNGCGVGFTPESGNLHGFTKVPTFQVIPSLRSKCYRGDPLNHETKPCESNGWTWTIRVGDSAEAWAKVPGKLLVGYNYRADRLVLDFSDVRGPGGILRGYGWVCNGYTPFAKCLQGIYSLMVKQQHQLLSEIDILDLVNMLGEILSSRRSAQIAFLDAGSPNEQAFQSAKHDCYKTNPHRRQSNNTLRFWSKPLNARERFTELLYYADQCGGDPAIENSAAAYLRAPWFSGSNPCHEILLADKGFCNLVTNVLPRFRSFEELQHAVYLIARANYRQTCVNLDDGVLQPQWHQTNEALRLCGVSLTGVCQSNLFDSQIQSLRKTARAGADSQADEWHMPRAKAVTTIKPEGTGTKCCGSVLQGEVMEGIHKPLGRHLFNWINFSTHNPIVPLLESAGYKTLLNPQDSNNVLVCFPVEYAGGSFDTVESKDVNLESALVQLERYRRWNTLWADHTVSCTVSYSESELPLIAEWLDKNWDEGFIAVSFFRRNDPTKTAADLGHPYLPQEVIIRSVYQQYVDRLSPVPWSNLTTLTDDPQLGACDSGACPVR